MHDLARAAESNQGSGVRHLKEMEEYAKIPPAVNQIEVGPPDRQPIRPVCFH
jgi:diketogulonate reductase-like aldo/keto reductase